MRSFSELRSFGSFLFVAVLTGAASADPMPPLSGAEGLIDARMARSGYRLSNIAPIHGRADPGKPGTQTVTLRSGRWAIAVFPVFSNCSISVSYKTGFGQPEIPADDGSGYAMIKVDATMKPPYSDIMLRVIDNTPPIGCPYHIKVFQGS